MITTTNGAPTNKTSGKECLDLFTRIGNMRWEHRNRILEEFETAYQEDKELATFPGIDPNKENFIEFLNKGYNKFKNE